MARLWAVLAVVVTFLVVAPVLESGTPNHDARVPGGRRRLRWRRRRRLVAPSRNRMRLVGRDLPPRLSWRAALLLLGHSGSPWASGR